MLDKVTFIKLQEVSEDGRCRLRYKGRDGKYHYLDVDTSLDKVVSAVRPATTPLDQISRLAEARKASSMTVEYFSVDSKPSVTTLIEDYTEPSRGGATQEHTRVILETLNDEMFEVSDTILVQGVHGYEQDGITLSDSELVLYVVARDDDNGLRVQAVNGKKIGTVAGCVPSIDEGTRLVRMGRAAAELDVMSPQFEALPQKHEQYCQIFKSMVSESSMDNVDEDSKWTPSDMEEAAIHDMRRAMEKTFLFGVKARIWDNTKQQLVTLTEGIWHQAGKTFEYDSFSQDVAVDLLRKAFTKDEGGKHKVLLAGSGLVASINKMDYSKVVKASDSVTKWGIDFTELHSKFGTLSVILCEVFDDSGMEDNGIVIDLELLKKYTFEPFSRNEVNADGESVTVFSETSCLVLMNSNAHMRIVKE